MRILLLTLLAVQSQKAPLSDAASITLETQRASEQGTSARLERAWHAAITRNATDRRALLALGSIARLRYDYDRADSLYRRVLAVNGGTPDSYDAAAHVGMAAWRSLGGDIRGADSLSVLALNTARAVSDSRLAHEALMSLSRVRGRTAGPKAGLELVREARVALQHPRSEDLANLACAEGAFLGLLGDTTAGRRVEEGTRIAERAKSVRARAACKLQMAQTVERSGAFGLASSLASDAVADFARAGDQIGVAVASQWLGYARTRNNRLTQGRIDLERAVRASRMTRYARVEAWARSGLAELFVAVGDLTTAREHAQRAARLHVEQGDLWGLAVARTLEGRVFEAEGLLADARAKFVDAVASMRRAGLPYNAVEALRLTALVDLRTGAFDSAQRSLDEASRLARVSGNTGWLSEAAVHRARLAMLRGDLTTADSLVRSVRSVYDWRGGEWGWTSVQFALYEAQLGLAQQRPAVAESAVTFVSSAIARWRQRVRDGDIRVGLARMNVGWTSLGETYPDLVAKLVASNRLDVAFRLVESVRARELAEGSLGNVPQTTDTASTPQRQVVTSGAVADVDAVRRSLRPEEGLISLTLGLYGAPTTAIVVTRDSAFARTLPAREVLAPLIERYQRIVATGTEPARTGRDLGLALLDPIVAALPAGVTRLLISPDGDLFRVPFDALRITGDRHVVERFAVAVVPSATVALLLRSYQPSTSLTRFVAIGDPTFTAENRRTGSERSLSDASKFDGVALARLPHSASEARRVAQYGVRSIVWTGASATETATRQANWRDVAVAHFATHALIDRYGQARSALALSATPSHDGFLTAAEISTLRFNGAMVTLSACQTLGGHILSGEGLRGLAGPLLEVGARAVVATLWPIGDRSTLPFVDRFYANMAAGANVADALRSAKLSAISDGVRISDWAAFTVIGDATIRPALRPRRLSPIEWRRDQMQPLRDTTGT